MALKAEYRIRCGCGEIFTGDVYEYVFAEYDPELKDAILSGEINRVPCPSCGQRLSVDNRFLYRDEKNRLWVWVCKLEDEPQREALEKELLEKNTQLECHFLEDEESYRKLLVFGRDALIGLLLKEDPELKKSEEKILKRNPAVRLAYEEGDGAGYMWFVGKKIRASMPLRFPGDHAELAAGLEGKRNWLKHYSCGMNIHNPFSSFLGKRLKAKWDRIREQEPTGDSENEFDDFAKSWAYGKMDARGFRSRYPGRRRFFDELKKLNVSRKVRSLRASPSR